MSTLQPSGLCSTCETVIQAGPGDDSDREYKPFKTARELLDAADLGCYICWTITHTKRWIDSPPETFEQGLQYNILTNARRARFSESEQAVRGSGSKIFDFLYSPFRRLFQPSSRPSPGTTFASAIERSIQNQPIRFEAIIVAGGKGPEASGAAHSWTFKRPEMTGLLLPCSDHAM